jgi:hypothetical protein
MDLCVTTKKFSPCHPKIKKRGVKTGVQSRTMAHPEPEEKK